ncbi:MAG: hypothetical protein WDM84_09705 [Bauldia sp.]
MSLSITGRAIPDADARGRLALAAGWVAGLAAFAVAAARLAAIPPALSSDDALFFVHALTRFSVLDFSPQFPGYPGFVAMGRLLLPLAGDPLHALALLTATAALALPAMAALVVWRATGSGWGALAAFAVTLSGPLMPDLAVSVLSDGSGILFLLAFLALLPRQREDRFASRSLFAGMALAWAIACRPSDAPLFAGALAGAVIAAPRVTWPVILGGAIVLVPVAVVVLALEGPLYVGEGLRFLSGHAELWGNTPFAAGGQTDSWLATLRDVPFAWAIAVLTVAAVAIALPRARRSPVLAAAVAAFLAHAAWIAAFQNPDHLRHLAPLAILGGVILPLIVANGPPARWRTAGVALLLAANVAALASSGALRAAGPPPLAAAEAWLAAEPSGTAVATNDGVFLLRAGLPQTRVYDMHYPADASLGLATAAGAAFRLTGTPIAGQAAAAIFPGRFPGERTLRLYRAMPRAN